MNKVVVLLVLFLLGGVQSIIAQVEYRWLAAGSFHNFYSNMGSEIESGFIGDQQAGWQWPAIYAGQDAQAFKGFWLGVENFPNPAGGSPMPHRVVHVGPRANGLGEFYPIEMTTTSKSAPSSVSVDGLDSFRKSVQNDEVDPTMSADRKIRTVMNTLLGITVERTIMQFSQQYHDNYHIIEYTFTNTGNTDDDDEIELPDLTIEGFMPFFLNRMAPVKATRHTIGNGTGWGMNTMNDRRGDGLRSTEEPEQFRAQFAWHGHFPPFTDYDNVGGPIWVPAQADITNGFLSEADTTGRLAAYHFVGSATLHADTAPGDETDDPGQPSTMSEEESDHILFDPNSDSFNTTRMTAEYNLMSRGRTAPRHAYQVEPTGYDGFVEPTGDPALGTGGGYSYFNSYGPYDLAPGEDIKIVVVEASAGISKELAEQTGRAYKNGEITAREKNEVVFQSRDSLFQTFERAIANYESDYAIPSPPEPPSFFSVNSAGDGIVLEWIYEGDSAVEGFDIYRASSRVDSTYRLLYRADASESTIKDGDIGRTAEFLLEPPIRGRDYYYYIQSVGPVNNDGTGATPTGAPLKSSRYFSQSYDPARLLRPAGEAMSEIVVVPNPFSPNIESEGLKLDDTGLDRIAFYEIPSFCTIKIYTELGELIRTIEHTNGSGDEFWDVRTDYRQRIASGVYIARIINEDPNDDEYGSVAIRKIVIIL